MCQEHNFLLHIWQDTASQSAEVGGLGERVPDSVKVYRELFFDPSVAPGAGKYCRDLVVVSPYLQFGGVPAAPALWHAAPVRSRSGSCLLVTGILLSSRGAGRAAECPQ